MTCNLRHPMGLRHPVSPPDPQQWGLIDFPDSHPFTATHIFSLHHTSSHCNTRPLTATHIHSLQHTPSHCIIRRTCLLRGGGGGSFIQQRGNSSMRLVTRQIRSSEAYQKEILKRQLATHFTIYNDSRADFWEILDSKILETSSTARFSELRRILFCSAVQMCKHERSFRSEILTIRSGILKSQLDTQFTIYNDYRADFWEILDTKEILKSQLAARCTI